MSQPLQQPVRSGLATAPHEYHHLQRGPRFAWWRPPLALVTAMALLIAAAVLLAGAAYLFGLGDEIDAAFSTDEITPGPFAVGNLIIALLIPVCLLASRIVHRTRSGTLTSVTGSFRWGWFLRCSALLVPVYAVYVALDLLLDPPESARPAEWALLMLLVLTTTPLQAAGEEYLFRGTIMQNIGASFRNSAFALAVASGFSVLLFASAHGSADTWIFLDLAVFGAACCFLAWRTGGLEAPIALHAINNMVGMYGSLLFGGWGEGFVDENSQGDPQDLILTLAVCAVALPLMSRLAARYGIGRQALPAPA